MATRMLPVQLTEADLKERGEELAAKVVQLVELKEQKKEEAKAAKERIDALEAQIVALSGVVRAKQEPRAVEVKEVPDVHRKVMEVVRLDTGKVIESRALTPLELEDVLQQRLAFEVHEGDLNKAGLTKRGGRKA